MTGAHLCHIQRNSLGEGFKQPLTATAKLGQQVNWYHKPFLDHRQGWLQGDAGNKLRDATETVTNRHSRNKVNSWISSCCLCFVGINWTGFLLLTCCEDLFFFFLWFSKVRYIERRADFLVVKVQSFPIIQWDAAANNSPQIWICPPDVRSQVSYVLKVIFVSSCIPGNRLLRATSSCE